MSIIEALETKKEVKSILDDIPGVGPSRRKALMLYFKSIEAIREADVDQLLKVTSINEKKWRKIYTKIFHTNDRIAVDNCAFFA